MCSRFENKETGKSIFEKFQSDNFILENFEGIKTVSIAPTDDIIIIRKEQEMYKIQKAQWGIKFNNDSKTPLIFNSRIETIKSKPFWKNLFKENRCLIPFSGFYEWKNENGKKVPQKISMNKDLLFFILGIFFINKGVIMSSMITSEPNEFMKTVHNRMPVICSFDNSLDFLNSDYNIALSMCQPFEGNDLMCIERADDLISKI